MALTAIDLAKSASLQEDVQLRKTLQKDIGSLKNTSSGKNMTELREHKVKQRKTNYYIAIVAYSCENNLVLKIDQDYSIKNDADLSPISTNKNNFY